MSNQPDKDRKVLQEIEISATSAMVWKALIDAEELARWFPLGAEVEPEVGGLISFSWGEHYPEMVGKITALEPQKHLQFGYSTSQVGLADSMAGMVTDYHISAKGGKTVLRVVQSGFAHGEDWDDLYDGINKGWQYQLRSLKNYLENHSDEDRQIIWILKHINADKKSSWNKLISADGFGLDHFIDSVAEGDQFSIDLQAEKSLYGTVLLADPPNQFCGTMKNYNNSFLGVSLNPHEKGQTAQVFVSMYGIERETKDALEQDIASIMDHLFS